MFGQCSATIVSPASVILLHPLREVEVEVYVACDRRKAYCKSRLVMFGQCSATAVSPASVILSHPLREVEVEVYAARDQKKGLRQVEVGDVRAVLRDRCEPGVRYLIAFPEGGGG